MTLTNDVAELSGVVNLTSADFMLEMDGREWSFKRVDWNKNCNMDGETQVRGP